jgi:hypothetical protein
MNFQSIGRGAKKVTQYLKPGPMYFPMPKTNSEQEWEIKIGTRCERCLQPRDEAHICKKKNAKKSKTKT